MPSISKIKAVGNTYHLSPSNDGTLTGYTSGDEVSPDKWVQINAISSTETNGSIFSKLTTMVRNVRYLYNKLGTADFSATGQSTVIGALSSLQSGLDSKSPASHTHVARDLPVSNSQVNSTSYIPTSALIYSMQQQINAISGGGGSGEITPIRDDPNDRRYESTNLGTWSTASDVNTFFNKFNHDTNYQDGDTKLRVGNFITILDGTYNSVWEIAGFDMESNQMAADSTTFDNGYGICFIPKTQLTTGQWNTSKTLEGGYNASNMHTSILPEVATNLKNILGTHIVNRNVLLSNSVDSSNKYYSNSYAWTTADATLLSVRQMNGSLSTYTNKYDEGEANYKLPIFNSETLSTRLNYWTRCIYGVGYGSAYRIWFIYDTGDPGNASPDGSYGIRPMIYLR